MGAGNGPSLAGFRFVVAVVVGPVLGGSPLRRGNAIGASEPCNDDPDAPTSGRQSMAPEFDLIGTYREWLARGLYSWLEWWAAKAADRPADRRYVQEAKALYLAARDVMALPDDDPRLLRLAHLRDAGDGAVREFLEQECRIIAPRLRFCRHADHPGVVVRPGESRRRRRAALAGERTVVVKRRLRIWRLARPDRASTRASTSALLARGAQRRPVGLEQAIAIHALMEPGLTTSHRSTRQLFGLAKKPAGSQTVDGTHSREKWTGVWLNSGFARRAIDQVTRGRGSYLTRLRHWLFGRHSGTPIVSRSLIPSGSLQKDRSWSWPTTRAISTASS